MPKSTTIQFIVAVIMCAILGSITNLQPTFLSLQATIFVCCAFLLSGICIAVSDIINAINTIDTIKDEK